MTRGTEVPTFPVMVLIGLTVFGLAFVASEGDIGVSGGTDAEKLVYTSESFGQVGDSNQDRRIARFGDFNVGEMRGDVQAYTSSKEEVSRGFFSSNEIEVEYNATQPKAGKVTFEVLGRNGPGQVYVKVNGEKVWQEHLVSTGTPEIEIPRDRLDPGANTVKIGSTRGGILSSTSYTLEDVEITVNDRKFHDYRGSFQVYDYEMKDFVSSELTFSIGSSVKTSPLEIYINDREVYSKRQVRIAPETVSIDPGEADLHPGYNSIRFETGGEAKYDIKNAELQLRYLGNTEQRTLRVDFGVNRTGLSFAERDDTRERIVFDYQNLLPSQRPMVIELNNNSHRLTPENGRNTVDIDADELERSNQLFVRSNATYEMDSLEVLSEKVEG